LEKEDLGFKRRGREFTSFFSSRRIKYFLLFLIGLFLGCPIFWPLSLYTLHKFGRYGEGNLRLQMPVRSGHGD